MGSEREIGNVFGFAFVYPGTGTGLARAGGVWLRLVETGLEVKTGTEADGWKGADGRLRRLARRPEGGLKVGTLDLGLENVCSGLVVEETRVSSGNTCSEGLIGVGDDWRTRAPCPARDLDGVLQEIGL